MANFTNSNLLLLRLWLLLLLLLLRRLCCYSTKRTTSKSRRWISPPVFRGITAKTDISRSVLENWIKKSRKSIGTRIGLTSQEENQTSRFVCLNVWREIHRCRVSSKDFSALRVDSYFEWQEFFVCVSVKQIG